MFDSYSSDLLSFFQSSSHFSSYYSKKRKGSNQRASDHPDSSDQESIRKPFMGSKASKNQAANNPSLHQTSSSKSKNQMSLSSAKSDKHVLKPCTVTSHSTGNFFDLQPLIKKEHHDM